MIRRIRSWVGAMALAAVLAGWFATPSVAWQLKGTSTTSVVYNQGITFDNTSDPTAGSLFFDGVTSTANSGLYRTNSLLSRTGSNGAVIPSTKEGYNHVGDLTYDPVAHRVLLSLECYYPSRTPNNTCGTGAIGVVNPSTLSFQYYVNLDKTQVQKAMWAEISPDGQWIFTSGGAHGTNLYAYSAAEVKPGTTTALTGKDLGAILPSSSVTGAAFYVDPSSNVTRLLVSLNRGTSFEIVSFPLGTAIDGSPTLGAPHSELTMMQSSSNSEPEGLAVTSGLNNGAYPLGGILHWQMLPSIKLYSRILNYVP